MASVVFNRIKSSTNNQRFTARLSRAGDGLGRKQQMSAAQMMALTPCPPNVLPSPSTDTRAPLLKGEEKS